MVEEDTDRTGLPAATPFQTYSVLVVRTSWTGLFSSTAAVFRPLTPANAVGTPVVVCQAPWLSRVRVSVVVDISSPAEMKPVVTLVGSSDTVASLGRAAS